MLRTMVLLLASAATASAGGHDAIKGNKCLGPSKTLDVPFGVCGTFKYKPTGSCVKDQESGDALWELVGEQVAASLTLSAPNQATCLDTGVIDLSCYGAAASLGDATIVRKSDLDLCKVNCDYWKNYHNSPQECVTDAQCPDGVDTLGWAGEPKVSGCCKDVAEWMGTVCTMTDAQVTKAKTDATFQQITGCKTTNCAKWGTASQHGASLAFAFVTGLVSVGMVQMVSFYPPPRRSESPSFGDHCCPGAPADDRAQVPTPSPPPTVQMIVCSHTARQGAEPTEAPREAVLYLDRKTGITPRSSARTRTPAPAPAA